MAGRWCLRQKYLFPFPWKTFTAIQTIGLWEEKKKVTVVFTCLNVSDSTHTSQDSTIDGIKVQRDEEELVKKTWLR